MKHAEIIRRNLPLLKRDLHPEEVLDNMWSTGAFSDLEYEICKEEDKKRAQTEKLLEILMKKDEDVYKQFCVVLHENHRHLKEQLDKKEKHENSPSLVFVSETEVQERVSIMEQKVAVLQKELDDSRQEAQHTKAECERDVKELNVQHGQQETSLKKENRILSQHLEQEKNRTKAVQAMLDEMKGKNESLSKDTQPGAERLWRKNMKHAEIIRRNLPLLKRDLHPEEVLDNLWSTGAFSDLEYEICKEEDKKRAQTEKLLEILMKKDEDVYKQFCVVLHENHRHLKEQLDKKTKHEDSPSLVFVSETEVQERVSIMEQKVAVLQKELDDSRQEAQHTKAECERDVKELNVQHGQQETSLKKENRILSQHLEQEKNRTKAVQAMLDEMKGKNESLSKDLKDIQQKFEALTVIHTDRETSEKRDSLTSEATLVEETGCVLKTSSDCDTRQLLLLPCLHAACKPCIDQLHQKNIVCSCGRDINMVEESGTVDFVRRNEILFAKAKPECEYQTEQCKGEVVHHCKTCNISMCANCTTKHETTRATFQHTVVLAEDFKKMPIQERLGLSTCSTHHRELVKYFDKQCNTSVCDVCIKGNHADHGIKALDVAFEKTEESLVNKVRRHKEYLEKIKASFRQQQTRVTELEERADQVKKEIADVHSGLALSLVQRLKHHTQQIEKQVEENRSILRKDMECLETSSSAVLTTLRYAERAMASTTHAQFMDLSSTIVNKIDEDLLRALPEDSVKTQSMSFIHQGHRALHELVEMFGTFSTSDKGVDELDTMPTIKDLQNEIFIFKDREKDFKMERKRLIENATFLKDYLEPLGIYFLDARKIDRSSILQCIHLKYDKDRVNLDWVHINTEGDLVNRKSDTRPAGEGRLKKYRGTCSTAPLPRAGCPQYWEIESRVSLDKPLAGNNLILEVGMCREEQRDVHHCISGEPSSCSMAVAHCTTHGGICRDTWKEGKHVLCLPDTLPNTAGSSHTLHYGVVYDDARKKIVFIDVKENKVMSTLDNVDSSQPLWPMFGVYNPEFVTVSMTLVVGSDINMREEKKALIVKALS
ncbi:paramyosin-like isoform X1 [Haliotis cracherodii]|uniref:paramyosin-like isoform X1 n=2 Tax=Haliotis cracherodii TaxID=6455 RepID=UPI0039EC9ADA